MANWDLDTMGLAEAEKLLDGLRNKIDTAVAVAMYHGAGVVADEYRRQIEGIPVDPRCKTGVKYISDAEKNPITYVLGAEKDALLNAIGIAKFDRDADSIATSIGLNPNSGYAPYSSKKYKKGIPIPMLARSVNSGSTIRRKYPFVKKAASAAKDKAVAAAIAAAEAKIAEMKKQFGE